MTSRTLQAAFASTSAGGAWVQQLREPIFVGCILAQLGTSTAHALPLEMTQPLPRSTSQTNAGTSVRHAADHAGPSIAELRRRSGLTWEQLARLFEVSRRSLHFWASGKPMSPTHEEHLQRMLAVMRRIDRGSAAANRSALLCAREDETIPFDLLAARNYERVLTILGESDAQPVQQSRLASQAASARSPQPPEELVGALQDRIHPATGRLLASKAISVPRRKK